MSERRIELKLSRKNYLHRKVIEKIENYDKSHYSSLTDYIVHAVVAYEEPVPVAESLLRKIIREELKGTGAIVQDTVVHKEKQKVLENEDSREEATSEIDPMSEQEEIDVDPATLDFMNVLGV